MKILHVIPQFKNGGVETAVMSAIDDLNKRHQFKILTIEKSSTPKQNKSLMSLDSKFYSFYLFYKFIRLVFKEKPDLIVFSLWKSNVLALILYPFLKTNVLSIRTATIIHNSRYAHFADKLFTKIGIALADDVFFDSEASKMFTQSQMKIRGEVLSFKTKKYQGVPRALDKECLKFIFIGRLTKLKNVDKAILFIRELKRLGLNVYFDIYGPDEGDVDRCMETIKYNDLGQCIKFKGEISNDKVFNILKDYDFFLQLSSVEGMAMSVVESMQTGLVPCVTNVGQIKSYVTHLQNGFLFEADKISSVDYLSHKAKEFEKNFIEHDNYTSLSKSAIENFLDQKIYSEDFERKIVNLK